MASSTVAAARRVGRADRIMTYEPLRPRIAHPMGCERARHRRRAYRGSPVVSPRFEAGRVGTSPSLLTSSVLLGREAKRTNAFGGQSSSKPGGSMACPPSIASGSGACGGGGSSSGNAKEGPGVEERVAGGSTDGSHGLEASPPSGARTEAGAATGGVASDGCRCAVEAVVEDDVGVGPGAPAAAGGPPLASDALML